MNVQESYKLNSNFILSFYKMEKNTHDLNTCIVYSNKLYTKDWRTTLNVFVVVLGCGGGPNNYQGLQQYLQIGHFLARSS